MHTFRCVFIANQSQQHRQGGPVIPICQSLETDGHGEILVLDELAHELVTARIGHWTPPSAHDGADRRHAALLP